MFLWKTIRIIGYLFFLITLFIVIVTTFTKFNNSEILIENSSIAYSFGSIIGFLIGLLLVFFPSISLIKFSNKKIRNKKDAI